MNGEAIGSPVSALIDAVMLGGQRPGQMQGAPDPQLEDAWEQAEMQAHFEAVYAQQEMEAQLFQQPQENLEEVWEEAKQPDTLEQVWEEQNNPEEELEQAWEEAGAEVAADLWTSFLKQKARTEYSFAPINPFLTTPDPASLAQSLDTAGYVPEAILALEAEVQLHPASSDAWRRLGELHAECDNDIQALAALHTGLRVDPFNLDSLLAIGVSSLNEVRSEDVVRYLGQWLERNPEYTDIKLKPGLEAAIHAFEQACLKCPFDSKAATALGILYLQQRRFSDAEREFARGLEVEPHSYTLWNKLAAARYLQGGDALPAYERVLELRPSYVRAWANLGSCYWKQGNLHIAARFILCALALGPSDKHLWGKLATMFLLMDRLDLIGKIETQDPYVFSDEFDIVRRKSLA